MPRVRGDPIGDLHRLEPEASALLSHMVSVSLTLMQPPDQSGRGFSAVAGLAAASGVHMTDCHHVALSLAGRFLKGCPLFARAISHRPVSYTHLTLPTKRIV